MLNHGVLHLSTSLNGFKQQYQVSLFLCLLLVVFYYSHTHALLGVTFLLHGPCYIFLTSYWHSLT